MEANVLNFSRRCLCPRYRHKGVTCIVGIDARGFVLGPPIALALKVPFVMLRKKGKMPNSVTGKAYSKECVWRAAYALQPGRLDHLRPLSLLTPSC